MGKFNPAKQRKEFDDMVLSKFVLRWEKSVFARKRKWSELPLDILFMIFQKIGPINMLTKAIRLCRDWLELARNEPLLWRKVDMTCHGNKFGPNYLEDIACIAVNWSAGQLEEFSAEEFGSDDLLQYVAESTSNIKSINLIKCRDVSEEALKKIIKGWPLLEEIEFTEHWCSLELLQTIGLVCPQLKCFRYNRGFVYCGSGKNLIAKCIGRSMPNLHTLQLIGNRMTNKGLCVILEGCPQLKSLDVRYCGRLTIDQCIESDLERIKDLRLPDDSIDDFKFAHHVYKLFCTCCDWSFGTNSDNDSVSDKEFDYDSDIDNYFDMKYEHIIYQDWD